MFFGVFSRSPFRDVSVCFPTKQHSVFLWVFFCTFPVFSCLSHQILEKERHGPIYWNGLNAVSICTAKLLEEVLRNDDKFPNRGDMSMWKEYRDLRGYGYGPFTE